MKYKILLSLLVSGVLFNACSKDDETTKKEDDVVISTYVPGTVMEIRDLAIYAKDTIIRNPELIASFLDRNVPAATKSSFYPGLTSVPVGESNTVVKFLNNNRINVDGTNMQVLGYRDSLVVLAEYTSSIIPSFNTHCDDVLSRVPFYNPFTDCADGTCGTYRKTYPLLSIGANYYVPLLTYAVASKDCGATLSQIPAIGVVNDHLTKYLQPTDTVLVQYARLPLVSK